MSELDRDFIDAMIDWYTAAELVEVLDIDIEEIIEVFEDRILKNEKIIKEELRYDEGEED